MWPVWCSSLLPSPIHTAVSKSGRSELEKESHLMLVVAHYKYWWCGCTSEQLGWQQPSFLLNHPPTTYWNIYLCVSVCVCTYVCVYSPNSQVHYRLSVFKRLDSFIFNSWYILINNKDQHTDDFRWHTESMEMEILVLTHGLSKQIFLILNKKQVH